jgi:hypothetical protein
LLITSVVIDQSSAYSLIVTFGGPITWDGIGVPASFKATTSDGPEQSCTAVLDVGDDWIMVEFNGSIESGADWELSGAMEGISGAGGADVAWPQSGNAE